MLYCMWRIHGEQCVQHGRNVRASRATHFEWVRGVHTQVNDRAYISICVYVHTINIERQSRAYVAPYTPHCMQYYSVRVRVCVYVSIARLPNAECSGIFTRERALALDMRTRAREYRFQLFFGRRHRRH